MNIEEIMEKFSDHELELFQSDSSLIHYRFAKPGTGIYSQEWIITKSGLIVTGDCYSSIYQGWSHPTLKFLAGCHVEYFSSKCVADKDGQMQKVFDKEGIKERLIRYIVEHVGEDHLLESEYEDPGLTNEDKCRMIVQRVKSDDMFDDYDLGLFMEMHFEHGHDLMDWMGEHLDVFGVDFWEFNCEVLTPTPYYHLAALKMAYKYSHEKGPWRVFPDGQKIRMEPSEMLDKM